MYLYVHKGGEAKGKAGEPLIKKSLSMYLAEKKRPAPETLPEILRTEEGKPYFEGEAWPYFSVSHSGQLWVCLMAEFPVGVDIQKAKNIDIKSLAERYFSQSENAYVETFGEEGFFRLWTYKEAHTKLRGESIFENISKTSLASGSAGDSFLVEKLEDDKFGEIYFKEVEIGAGMTLSACVTKDEDIWLRLIE